MLMDDLLDAIGAMAVALVEADKAVTGSGDGENLSFDGALEARGALAEQARVMGDLRSALDDLIGSAMAAPTIDVPGYGRIERHTKKDRTAWDKDLYRLVLDTVMVDTETGEVREESEADKLRAVWNLGAPRLTALRARGIDPDEWCAVETRPGWTIRTF